MHGFVDNGVIGCGLKRLNRDVSLCPMSANGIVRPCSCPPAIVVGQGRQRQGHHVREGRMCLSQCGNKRSRNGDPGHELPRLYVVSAAARPLRTDTNATSQRDRFGHELPRALFSGQRQCPISPRPWKSSPCFEGAEGSRRSRAQFGTSAARARTFDEGGLCQAKPDRRNHGPLFDYRLR